MTIAIVFAAILAVLALFQLALALGAPWGRFAWGGQHEGVLPTGYRIGSAISVLVYAFIAVLALDRAQVIDVVPDAVSAVGMWVAVVLFALSVLMNAVSRSRQERYTMTPVAVVLAVLALLIALAGPATPTATPIGQSHPGFPAGLTQQQQEELYLSGDAQLFAWIDGRQLTLLTFGSTTCPDKVSGLELRDATTIEVTVYGDGEVCTDDLAPHTHVLTLSRAVTERPVTVVVNPGSNWERRATVD